MAGIVVTDGGCTVVADAGGAARAVDAMKAHLVDPEVCRMGAAVLYAAGLRGDRFLELGQCGLEHVAVPDLSPTRQWSRKRIRLPPVG